MPGLHRTLWICLNYAWLCMTLPEYARICINMPKHSWMVFALHTPIETLCLLELFVTYFNIFQLLTISTKSVYLSIYLSIYLYRYRYRYRYTYTKPSFKIVSRFYMCVTENQTNFIFIMFRQSKSYAQMYY